MPGMGSRREGGVDAEGERQVMMRAACLIRVSDASQVDGYSLDAQRREITRWCESRDYSAKFFVEEGVSAKTDRLDKRQLASGSAGWRALYAAAEAIGVNISALVKQLEEEGVLHVERTGHGSTLYPQAKLGDMLATTVSL